MLNLIVAVDKKNGISKSGHIPWFIKEDTSYFVDKTRNGVLIMGKNTYLECSESIFIDRTIIVVSSSLVDDKVIVVTTLNQAVLTAHQYNKNIFICGGKHIYHEALDNFIFNNIYITKIDYDYQCDNFINLNFNNNYLLQSSFTFNINSINVSFLTYSNNTIINNKEELKYQHLLYKVLTTGHFRKTRNGNVWSLFGKKLKFDLSTSFPVLTTKKTFFRGAVEEILFFLKGYTDTTLLSEKGIHYWEANTSREFLDSVGLQHLNPGDMGPLYGYNWRFFGIPYQGCDVDYNNKGGYDQIDYCLNLLKNDPYSRRIIMTTYDPSVANQACLFPCHGLMLQFYVDSKYRLNLSCYNRSQDLFLGVPINIIMSALLVHIFCEVVSNTSNIKLTPGKLIINMGDVHIYQDHQSQVIRQILREPLPFPTLTINRKIEDINNFKYEDFKLCNYYSHPPIKAKMIA